ncbi:MAG TPA: hypothetical protein VL285_10375 [Bryobacteraceae bacterium]|nr:hypothetical protein [Bryobacteraceae bacterium]
MTEPDPASQTEYGGPAILSRGGSSSLFAPSRSIRFRPYLGVNGTYDTGLTPVSLTSAGDIPDDASIGGSIELGVSGYHRFKTVQVGLDYRGSYNHYSRNSYYNGTEQLLSFLFTKQATRRVAFTLRESAGISNRGIAAYGGFGAFQLVDPNFSFEPRNEIFDGRTHYLSTMGDLTLRKSARLSFNLGADGFLNRRRSSALYGFTGYRVRGDTAYRTSRHATSGIAYDFTHFEFTKGFGASDIHTIQFVQSYRIGRNWELALKAGGSRVETLGLTRVAIDPVIAEIVGRTAAIEVIYRTNWVPNISASLSRSFRYSSLEFNYARGVTPGNGLFLTSRQESAGASYSYTGIRKVNLGLNAGYSSFGSLAQTLGTYSGFTGGAGFTYLLTRALHFVARYDYRHYQIDDTTFKRNSYVATVGFAFSPGELPLALW